MSDYIDPTREQFSQMMKLPTDEPIHMLNLIRFREKAIYEEGHALADAGLSGAEAYMRYGEESSPIFERVGGKIAHQWTFEHVLIGPTTERWDRAFVAQYPNALAFAEMVKDPAYQIAVKNRQAAVETSRLIRLKPKAAGGNFAQ